MSEAESKLLAAALYQCRILLGDYLGPESDVSTHLRLAAHLAYALHNDALAAMDGRAFDVQASLARIANIDRIIGGKDAQEVVATLSAAIASKPNP